ncbi:MAG TPA: O-methyltransferase [Solirubrobacter sp.]|nr:O-methyltransferase [Solirubrobacter sp.]
MASAYDFPGAYDYLTRFSGQDELLAQIARETEELPDAGMLSRADQGGLLTILAKMLDARVALEVGTFTGYGAICIARGLAPGGHLTCFEVDETYAEIARRNVARAGLEDRVTIKLGPAGDAIAQLPNEPHVDLAYIDADKIGYPAYYEALVPRLRPGGMLVLDNTLLRGRVLDPRDERAKAMAELNERIAADDRVDSVMLGLSDGVTLARKT